MGRVGRVAEAMYGSRSTETQNPPKAKERSVGDMVKDVAKGVAKAVTRSEPDTAKIDAEIARKNSQNRGNRILSRSMNSSGSKMSPSTTKDRG